MRTIVQKILAILAKNAINKHKITTIAVIGKGETSVAREYIYQSLNQYYPIRRNLEIPEIEFSTPLTVLGYMEYPKNYISWIAVLIKSCIHLIKNKPYKHILVLEIPEIEQSFWLNVLKPKIIINTPIHFADIKKILAKHKLKTSINLSIDYIPRIKLIKGKNGSLIIDSTYIYKPPPFKSILEFIQNLPNTFVLFSHDKADISAFSNQFPKAKINLVGYKPVKTDILIIRGPKQKLNPILDTYSIYE